jgi:hypothetical protein
MYPLHFIIRITCIVSFRVPNLQLGEIIASSIPSDPYLIILHKTLFRPTVGLFGAAHYKLNKIICHRIIEAKTDQRHPSSGKEY